MSLGTLVHLILEDMFLNISPVINTLAYYATSQNTGAKTFSIITLIIKTLSLVKLSTLIKITKLECNI